VCKKEKEKLLKIRKWEMKKKKKKKKKNSLTPCIKALFFFVRQKLNHMELLKNMH
jgi:hypothetical protein